MANKKVSQRLLTLEHRLERQSDTIKNIQENVDNTSKYQDLRQDVLKSQGSLINRWLSVIGIFLMVFGGYGVFVVRDEIKALDKLVKKSESTLAVIKTHSKNAKKYEEEAKVSASTAKKLANPEVELTKKTEQEVKKSGTKLQKLMLKIRQEDYKIAIDLWKYFIGRAYYENDKKYLSPGYFNLGYSHYKEGYYKKAIDALKKVIEIKPDYHEAYHNMGVAYNKLKEYQNAIDAFEKAIKIKSDFHDAYRNMGVAYNGLGKYQEAIDACKKAIEIKPDYHEAYNTMGIAYIGLRKHQKAIDTFKKAIKIKPDYHKAYNNMGVAYNGLGKYQEAIDAYKKAIKIKSDYHHAYTNLFELQLIQEQDFDQDLVQKFNMHDVANKTTKIFKMLTIFKSINNGTQVAGWQQAFSQKYQGVLEWNHWEWSNIEKWINSKPNDEKKQALQSALEFFKAQ